MQKEIRLPDENKKRAAFKRFSQMSTAGLAVLSLSAFADVSAKPLPSNAQNCDVKEQNLQILNPPMCRTFAIDESEMIFYDSSPKPYGSYFDVAYGNYLDYCEYNNYTNYSNSNYVNNYSNTYSNNYSNNYSDSNI